jgi:CubicO group peptidase (beta-lactamase class C family)
MSVVKFPLRRIAVVATAATVAAIHVVGAQRAPVRDSLFAAVDRAAARDMQTLGIPGIAVAFVDSGRIVYAKGYGTSNVETGAPVTPDMLFRVGSITKLVTAITVVAEAKARGISLDAPIARYMKGLSPRLGKVTLAQLLEHTAGVAEIITATPIDEDENEDDLVRSVRAWTDAMLFTEPGEVHSYSNPGYILAGAVIAAASGKRYTDLVADYVLKPVGMTRATFATQTAVTWPFSQGHVGAAGAPPQLVRPILTDARHLPSTFLWASAEDIARLAIAVMNHGIIDGRQAIDPAVIETIVKPRMAFPGATNVFGGLGPVVNEGGVLLWSKNGRMNGFGSRVAMAPTVNRAFVVLENRLDATPAATQRAAAEAIGAGGRQAPSVDTTGRVLLPAELVGRYLNGARVITISAGSGGGDALEIVDRDTTERTLRGAGRIVGRNALELRFTNDETKATGTIRFTVIRDASGRVKYLYTGERAFRRRGR